MPYAVICRDHVTDAAQQARARELQPHLDYIATIAEQVLVAGPLSTDGTGRYNASLFIYAVATEAEARRLLENDPYYQAGIYAETEINAFVPARGTWL